MQLSERNSVSTSITYKAESFNASARSFSWTVPPTVSHVSDVSYWDIERTQTSNGAALPTQSLTGNQSITLYYNTNDVVTDPTNLTICKNTSTATTTWIDIGGTGATAGTGSVTSTSSPSPFNSYSRFTLANKITGTNPLPIELIYFNASINNAVVDLTWETATEINNDYFLIEKSKDAIYFEPLEIVDAAGNSTTRLKYMTKDRNPFSNVTYYRLCQVDFDGKKTYSQIQSVEVKNNESVNYLIYPNPSDKNGFNIVYKGNKKQTVEIELSDLTGKVIYTDKITFDDTTTSIKLQDQILMSQGIYFLRIYSDEDVYCKKMVVEK